MSIAVAFLDRDDPRFDQLAPLFRKYYESMGDKGLMLPLVENGEQLWLESLRKSLGRFYQLVAAIDGNTIVGFVFGYVRITQPYLGSLKVGFWDGLYLEAEYRKGSTVLRMIRLLEGWFKDQRVHSCELQVLVGNEHTWRLWEGLGYKSELYQMRRIFPNRAGNA
ncbi:MAG: GNAT family N-acetyltransferase [Bacteroidetes bacterium]|nr:GNAT family N-acetyltransferase [Bacteroidota bacterium]